MKELFELFMKLEARDFMLEVDRRYEAIVKFLSKHNGSYTMNAYSNSGGLVRSIGLNNFTSDKPVSEPVVIDLCTCGHTWLAYNKSGRVGGQPCGMTPL